MSQNKDSIALTRSLLSSEPQPVPMEFAQLTNGLLSCGKDVSELSMPSQEK